MYPIPYKRIDTVNEETLIRIADAIDMSECSYMLIDEELHIYPYPDTLKRMNEFSVMAFRQNAELFGLLCTLADDSTVIHCASYSGQMSTIIKPVEVDKEVWAI